MITLTVCYVYNMVNRFLLCIMCPPPALHPRFASYKTRESIWSMDRLRQHLECETSLAPAGFVDRRLPAMLKSAMATVIHGAAKRLERRRGYFDLLGFDFMLDDTLDLHLIEGEERVGEMRRCWGGDGEAGGSKKAGSGVGIVGWGRRVASLWISCMSTVVATLFSHPNLASLLLSPPVVLFMVSQHKPRIAQRLRCAARSFPSDGRRGPRADAWGVSQ